MLVIERERKNSNSSGRIEKLVLKGFLFFEKPQLDLVVILSRNELFSGDNSVSSSL